MSRIRRGAPYMEVGLAVRSVVEAVWMGMQWAVADRVEELVYRSLVEELVVKVTAK